MNKKLSIEEIKNLRDSYDKEISNLRVQLDALEFVNWLLCDYVNRDFNPTAQTSEPCQS